MNCLLKKFILKTVNSTLGNNKASVDKARESVRMWTTRTRKVLECLESLEAKLEDNNIDDNELKAFVQEMQDLVKEW